MFDFVRVDTIIKTKSAISIVHFKYFTLNNAKIFSLILYFSLARQISTIIYLKRTYTIQRNLLRTISSM